MANITVIVPVHKLEQNYIVGCIESIKNQKVKPFEVLFVTSDDKELNDYLGKYDFGNLKDVTKIIKNETGNYDFQSQINYGVEQSTGDYFTFVDGMIVNKETFLENGGLKSNMKLTFTYEFLLRMSYKSIPIMVIPKLGYKHTNNREGSLFVEYKSTIDVLESKFWVNKAKKEDFFTEDREITYEV